MNAIMSIPLEKVAMNKSVIKYAPKDRSYCHTMSTSSRTHVAAGVDSVSYFVYFSRVICELGFQLPTLTWKSLEQIDKRKQWLRDYQKKPTTKLPLLKAPTMHLQ
jgi:hypothetical protein